MRFPLCQNHFLICDTAGEKPDKEPRTPAVHTVGRAHSRPCTQSRRTGLSNISNAHLNCLQISLENVIYSTASDEKTVNKLFCPKSSSSNARGYDGKSPLRAAAHAQGVMCPQVTIYLSASSLKHSNSKKGHSLISSHLKTLENKNR